MSNITEQNIQAFIRGYLAAALWSSTDYEGGSLDCYEWGDGVADKLSEGCRDFIEYAGPALEQYADKRGYDASHGSVWDYAGHDFWLTRNGHGAGFWDRGLGQLGEELTKAAKSFGSVDLYVGDDGYVYASGLE